tara:strand:- start:877 stop:1215 length:339 start_codon:yes stop_codon:yes gene_type:complete
MIWPPVKAWTSNVKINDQVYFVAINYGGTLQNRWVILMSVIDSNIVLKVPYSHLIDSTKWESGWNKTFPLETNNLIVNGSRLKNNKLSSPSLDSGLTIPISKNIIRPWFRKN